MKGKRKKKKESDFDKKMLTGLFVFIFFANFVVEGVGRYLDYKNRKTLSDKE